MRTIDRDTRKNRLRAGIAALAYVAVLLLLILLWKFRVEITDNRSEGLLLNFGNTETGSGPLDLPASDETAASASSSQATASQRASDVLTQHTEEAPVLPTQTQPNRPNDTQATPQQVDRRALFPGRTTNSTAPSEGTAAGAGNQGDPNGSPTGSREGTGSGTTGNSYNLDGRSLVGSLPRPGYPAREEGRVVIEIHVDQQGRVTRTAFRSVGSTTTNAALVAAAERAARQARFNVDETAPFPQIGTIIYNFRLE